MITVGPPDAIVEGVTKVPEEEDEGTFEKSIPKEWSEVCRLSSIRGSSRGSTRALEKKILQGKVHFEIDFE